METLKVISFKKIIETAGSGPLYCIVSGGDEYYCKRSNLVQIPLTDIINEVISNKILTLWELHCPPINYIELDFKLFKQYIEDDFEHRIRELFNGKTFSIKELPYKEIHFQQPIFGSRKITSTLLFDKDFETDNSLTEKIINPEDIILIAYFDLWFANQDRKKSNINILLSHFKLSPIDHCQLFLKQKDYANLNPKTINLEISGSIINTDLFRKLIKRISKMKREYFLQNITLYQEKAFKVIDTINSVLPSSWGFTEADYKNLKHFLVDKDRNMRIFETLEANL